MRTRDICLIALLSATLTAGKFALSFIANVEIVTLFLVVYALTLPRSRVLLATITFIITDMILYGVHVWVIMYLIHWPLLVLCVSFLKGKKAPLFAIIIGIVFTMLFGVQTTVIEVLTFINFKKVGFIKAFIARYSTGISFFITHVVSNAIILSVLVYPLYRIMDSLARQYFREPSRMEPQKAIGTPLKTEEKGQGLTPPSSQEETSAPEEETHSES